MRLRICISGLVVAAIVGGATLSQADWIYQSNGDKWVHVPPRDVETETSDLQFQRALEAWKRGDNETARKTLEGWIRYYRHRRDSQSALFLLGEIYRSSGDFDAACKTYEELLNRYAGTDLFDRVLGIQTEIAEAYLGGRKRRVMKVFWVSAQDEGVTLLEKVFQRDPRGVRGKNALRTLADYHFRIGQFALAEDEYQRLATNFPNDPETATFKLLAAQSALARFRGVRTDGRALDEADARFRRVQQDHPELARREHVEQVLTGINERKAEKDFEVGQFYQRTGKTKGAIFYYQSVARGFPGTVWAQRAREQLAGLGVDPDEKVVPPTVLAAGIGLQPDGQPLPADAVLDGSATDREDRAPVVLWAGPAPILRTGRWEGVIDIGPPDDEQSPVSVAEEAIPQLGETALPPTPTER